METTTTNEVKYKGVILQPVDNVLSAHRDGYDFVEKLRFAQNPTLDPKVKAKQKEVREAHTVEVKEIKSLSLPQEDIDFLLENQSVIFKQDFENVITDYQLAFNKDVEFFKGFAKQFVKNFNEIEKFLEAEDFDIYEFAQAIIKCYAFFFSKSKLRTE